MTMPTFTEVEVPDEIPRDQAPETETPKLPTIGDSDRCPKVDDETGTQCKNEPGHRGRHRYKERVASNVGTSSSRSTSNERLAKDATALLAQLNGVIALGCMPFGFHQTASAIAAANDQFESSAYQALLADPALCRMILKGGAASGKLALTLAYGMLTMSVVPTAYMELRERRASRDDE